MSLKAIIISSSWLCTVPCSFNLLSAEILLECSKLLTITKYFNHTKHDQPLNYVLKYINFRHFNINTSLSGSPANISPVLAKAPNFYITTR